MVAFGRPDHPGLVLSGEGGLPRPADPEVTCSDDAGLGPPPDCGRPSSGEILIAP